MGAMKDLAIELERKQHDSGDGHAFVMGLLAAADLILDARSIYVTRLDAEAQTAWRCLGAAFDSTMDAADYLGRLLDAAHANGPSVGG